MTHADKEWANRLSESRDAVILLGGYRRLHRVHGVRTIQRVFVLLTSDDRKHPHRRQSDEDFPLHPQHGAHSVSCPGFMLAGSQAIASLPRSRFKVDPRAQLRSTAYDHANQLRDPAMYEENRWTFLLIAVAEEVG